jgi:hypothetical protein
MPTKVTTGYSGTPLAKKLGYKASFRVAVMGAPKDYGDWLEPLPEGVTFESSPTDETDLIHLFVTEKSELVKQLTGLRNGLEDKAGIWVSWPKKASKVPTDITDNVIREVAFPLGLVDIKVCAVSEVWSALKLVVRQKTDLKTGPRLCRVRKG